jgi:hypothetical protein
MPGGPGDFALAFGNAIPTLPLVHVFYIFFIIGP